MWFKKQQPKSEGRGKVTIEFSVHPFKKEFEGPADDIEKLMNNIVTRQMVSMPLSDGVIRYIPMHLVKHIDVKFFD